MVIDGRPNEGGRTLPPRPLKAPGSATWADFERLDIRVGRVVHCDRFPEAHKASYKLAIDFGAGVIKHSSAQVVGTYPQPSSLVGRLVVAVVNFPPKRIAGFSSEVLVLGALPDDGRIPLLFVDEGASPGDPIG